MDIQQLEQDAYNLGIFVGQAPAQQEAYTWGAIYDDDTLINEYDREEGLGFAEVNQSRVKALFLYPTCGEGLPYNGVKIPQGATPIFFRRRRIVINLAQETSASRPTVHCIGWKKADEAVYLFVFDDGSTLLTNDLQAV